MFGWVSAAWATYNGSRLCVSWHLRSRTGQVLGCWALAEMHWLVLSKTENGK